MEELLGFSFLCQSVYDSGQLIRMAKELRPLMKNPAKLAKWLRDNKYQRDPFGSSLEMRFHVFYSKETGVTILFFYALYGDEQIVHPWTFDKSGHLGRFYGVHKWWAER